MTQFPSPDRFPQGQQRVKRLRPKSYSVAVYLVIALVVLQVSMIVVVFWLRAMVVSVKVSVPKADLTKTTQHPIPPPTLIGPEPPKPDVMMPGLPLKVPHTARLSLPGEGEDLDQIGKLNEDALALVHAQALESAVETLIKAEDIDPRYPDTLKNLAETYNLLNEPVTSKVYWQRLVDIGPAVGTIYGVAKDDVRLLNAGHEADTLNAPSTYSRLVYIDTVEKTPVETVNGAAQFHLRATLMRQADKLTAFDQKKLQPYVIFYQKMADGSFVPDLAQHKGSFDDTFLFWGGKTGEPFGVTYLMPNAGAPGPGNVPIGKYYGFVIGIYYNKVLQDAHSEPADLITRIPLPDEIE